jgi:hypothetical protein
MVRCKRRTSKRRQKHGLGRDNTVVAQIIPAKPALNFI